MQKLKKRLIFALVIFAFLAYFVYRKWPDSSIKVVFCDVGQGDSILIQQGFFQVLIDSGRDDRVLNCLGRVLPAWDRTLEVMILTHGDEDHVGYAAEILSLYQTNFLFFPDTGKDNTTLQGLEAAILQETAGGMLWKQPILGQSIGLPDGGTMVFLERPGENQTDLTENDRSIVFLLEYGDTRWLFTGDLEEKGEQNLVKNGLLPLVDVLKVGHHGSASSSSLDFLERTRPVFSVISAGLNNKYGHPTAVVLERLQKIGSVILRTDELGDIDLATDGHEIWVQSTYAHE
jgi:competence protein ComEC